MKELLIVIALSGIVLISYSIVSDTVRVEERHCDVYHESIDPRVHGSRCRSYEDDKHRG